MSDSAAQLAARSRALRPGFGGTFLRGVGPLLVGLGVAIALQFLKPMMGEYNAKLVLDIGVAVVLAVSLNIVNGFTGQFSMGHAGFMAVGGYASGAITYYASQRWWGDLATHGGILSGRPNGVLASTLPLIGSGDGLFLLALLVGGLVAALLGVVVGLPSLRLKGDYLAIVTLGFGEILRVCIQQTGPVIKSAEEARALPVWKLAGSVGGALGFTGIPKYTSLFWVYAVAAVTILVAYRLKRGTYGRAFLSIREDEIASEAMGVNTTRYKVWAFVISAFFAGVAGGLFAHTLGVGLSAESAGFLKSFDIIIMVVLGGLGSISGAALAAVVVTLLPEWLRDTHVGPLDLSNYRLVIYALALILMMIFRPKGLLGVREVWDAALWRWLPGRGGGDRS